MHCKNLTGNSPDIWGMTGTFCPLNVFFLKPFEGKIPDIYNYVSQILFQIYFMFSSREIKIIVGLFWVMG